MSDNDELYDIEADLLRTMTMQAPDFQVTMGKPLEVDEEKASKEQIIEGLRLVADPEIMINIYDLGLVYDIRQKDNGDVEVDMTLTAPTCPVAGILPEQAANAVSDIKGVGVVTVKVVWEPAWTPDRLTEEAKAILEMY
jgi:FeS assembly SUF system protein